jgi:hypothetical protein
MSLKKTDPRMEFENNLKELKLRIDLSTEILHDIEGRHLNGECERALIFCLKRAIEIARTVIFASENHFLDSSYVLDRALLDTLFLSHWIAMSEENAKQFYEYGLLDRKRMTLALLDAGYWEVIRKSTGKVHTDEFTQLLKEEPVGAGLNFKSRLNTKSIAETSGLLKLYILEYGIASTEGHGLSFGFRLSDEEENLQCYRLLRSSSARLKCIALIAIDRAKRRRTLDPEKILKILGVAGIGIKAPDKEPDKES